MGPYYSNPFLKDGSHRELMVRFWYQQNQLYGWTRCIRHGNSS